MADDGKRRFTPGQLVAGLVALFTLTTAAVGLLFTFVPGLSPRNRRCAGPHPSARSPSIRIRASAPTFGRSGA